MKLTSVSVALDSNSQLTKADVERPEEEIAQHSGKFFRAALRSALEERSEAEGGKRVNETDIYYGILQARLQQQHGRLVAREFNQLTAHAREDSGNSRRIRRSMKRALNSLVRIDALSQEEANILRGEAFLGARLDGDPSSISAKRRDSEQATARVTRGTRRAFRKLKRFGIFEESGSGGEEDQEEV